MFLSRRKEIERPVNMKERQDPLMAHYRQHPADAVIHDCAETASDRVPANDPLHTEVSFGHTNPARLKMGVHRAVGGECDLPNPGEMLSAAIASCLDTTIRIIANRFDLPLAHLSVQVDAVVDTRGTLMVSSEAPVGFQSLEIRVDIEPAIPVEEAKLDMLLNAAEACCVVLQTIKRAPAIALKRAA